MVKLKAFSLVELLVVVVIVGILMSVAIPSYKNHIAKTKLFVAYTYLSMVKNAAMEHMLMEGAWPKRASDLNIDLSSLLKDELTNISIGEECSSSRTKFCIQGMLHNSIESTDGAYIALELVDVQGLTSWRCTNNSVNTSILPKQCKDT